MMSVDWDEILPDTFDEYVIKPEFEKDFENLWKRYQTLDEDLHTFLKTQLQLYHLSELDNRKTKELVYVDPDGCEVFKTVQFACKALGGRGGQSGIRVIHAYYDDENKVELIEMYYKGDKKNEDRERIKKYY